ncbi:ribonuclease P protein component [Arcanobacterium bovis]|uniref:Ribonuclease P protein component n=1 Tax=Arcanobacterium bovis TaxID=2529275 RepID=A0A4Q9UZ62_9ACTO|nr:ribonuclease P protein component [Arcanobacterium bovis]TBW21032.1 ribonuclease P protein component [Arcanobacterium bovis]
MLPAANRMRKSGEFSQVFRHGKRSGNQFLVVHTLCDGQVNEAGLDEVGFVVDKKIGFVVGKAVGNSVVRHRVTRKLRHILRNYVDDLECDALVIRALSPAAGADFHTLEKALVREFRRLNILQESR